MTTYSSVSMDFGGFKKNSPMIFQNDERSPMDFKGGTYVQVMTMKSLDRKVFRKIRIYSDILQEIGACTECTRQTV